MPRISSFFFATAVYLFWALKFQPGGLTQVLLWIGVAGHLIVALITIILSARAARAQRPTRFFGSWLHQVLERFADVILSGDIEVVTPHEIADAADKMLAQIPSRRLSSIKMALLAIDLGALLRFRVPMSRMGRRTGEQYLTAVFRRGVGPFRDLIKIKQLIFMIYYSDERTYNELGFVRFQDREKYQIAKENDQLPTGDVIYPPVVTDPEIETEVCVIGSGAGGAVVAARLAEANKQVVILEAGPYLRRDRISHNEREMQAAAYREGGLQLTADFDMYVLQGRCVGGSTFMNNGICFQLPDAIFQQWQELDANLDHTQLQASFQRVSREIGIIDLAQRQHLIEKGSLQFMNGCQRLGIPAQWFKVNLGGCIGCGYCTLGCPYEKKMSVDLSYIPRALAAGATLVSECEATKITTQGSKVHTVVCRRGDGSRLTVKAEKIIVAGGAINSSLLLLRSEIKRNVGTRLCFNVGSWVFAQFPEPINAFDGIQQCAFHERPRYFLETLAMPPGAFAAAMPGWFHDHFDKMRHYRYFAVAGALVGTQAIGRIKPSKLPFVGDLLSPINFTLPAADLRKLKEGIRQVCRIFLAAGATRVIPATFQPLEFIHPAQLYRLDDFIVEADDVAFGSSHPQGGNPMSDDRKTGVVDSQFRVHGFDNLFVCDASVFPSAVQVNPQLTIMALADYAAQQILQL